MKINEVAKLTGVTVRTLHYYDEIGLLQPNEITEAGYRLYDSVALETLQQILFFKELGFPLNDIKEIMSNPHYDKAEALTKHKELLLQKRARIDDLIDLVDNTLKGENDMSFKQFDMTEFEGTKKKYADEVKERWGNTEAYSQFQEKTKGYKDKQWDRTFEKLNDVFKKFAQCSNKEPDSEQAQMLVKELQDCITGNFYPCTKEILEGLGQMYIADERFAKNIDKHGEGTAAFVAAAIATYCQESA